MRRMDLPEPLEVMLHNLREAGEAFARAKASRLMAEHMRKVVLALEQKTHQEGCKSVAAQEREALASERYKQHISDEAKACFDEEMARTRLKDAEYRLELYRTESANLRAERVNT